MNKPFKIYKELKENPAYSFFLLYTKAKKNINLLPLKLSLPVELTIFLNNYCNLKCSYCSFLGEAGIWKNKKKEILSVNELKNIFNSFSKRNLKILYTGGEPLLHPQIIEILKEGKKNNFYQNVFTNGTLLAKNEKIIFFVDKILISLDGHNSFVNDLLRGSNSFNTTLKNIKHILKLKQKLNLKTPAIEICTTITSKNYIYLDAIYKLVLKLQKFSREKIFLNLQFLFSADEKTQQEQKNYYKTFLNKNSKHFSLPLYNDKELNVSQLERKLKKLSSAKNLNFFPKIKYKYYKNSFSTQQQKNNFCFSPWTELVIYANGKVEICPDFVLGNIKKQNLKQIWQGKKLKELRAILQKQTMPQCKHCCHLYKW